MRPYAIKQVDIYEYCKTLLNTNISKARAMFEQIQIMKCTLLGGTFSLLELDLTHWMHEKLDLKCIRFLQDGALPGVLYLQMDNCWRENKNIYVLGMCALLVQTKIFRKVIAFRFKTYTLLRILSIRIFRLSIIQFLRIL